MSHPHHSTAEPPQKLWPIATVMATAVFATTFVQIQGLGYFPILKLLKDQMGLDSNQTATFMALSTLPWSFKAVAGLLVDGVPLFGSRRRNYLLLSAVLAGVMWVMMGVECKNYDLLLICAVGMNCALVLGSSTAGGLMVEAGQRFNASGKISSLRVMAQNIGAGIGMPLGGYLAGIAFGWTSTAALLPLFCLFAAAWLWLKEPPLPKRIAHGRSFAKQFVHVVLSIWKQIVNVLRWQMVVPALLLFFIQAVPSFRSTSFYEYQTNTLGYSEKILGWLGLAGYAFALLSSAVYAWSCRKISLRTSLYAAIILTSLSCLPYLFYTHCTPDSSWIVRAVAIEGIGTFLQYLAYVPLFDLAIRSTPKGSEALGFSVLISIWNIGLAIGTKAGPWIYQNAVTKLMAPIHWFEPGVNYTQISYNIRHAEINNLIWLNAYVTLAGIAIVFLIPKALVNKREENAGK